MSKSEIRREFWRSSRGGIAGREGYGAEFVGRYSF